MHITLTNCFRFAAGIAGQQGVYGHHHSLIVKAICVPTEEPRVAIVNKLFNDRCGAVSNTGVNEVTQVLEMCVVVFSVTNK